MFNSALVMGSWQHLVALAVVLSIILLVFFTRKLFMKFKIADIIFRYSLGLSLIIFELVLQLRNGARPLFGRIIADTYPLCGYMIWFSAIALMSNSKRLMKLIYPLTILGGSLSLIFIDMHTTFPDFGAIQFWWIHGGFMVGSLYFFFTKKISKYTLKDLGRSCLFLFCISGYVLLIYSGMIILNPGRTEPLYVFSPPPGLGFIKDSLGQVGYTVVYILFVISILFAIYGITYLCTIKRKSSDENNQFIHNNKVLDFISKITPKIRYISLIIIFGLGLYSSILNKIAHIRAFLILDEIFFLLLIVCIIINEITTLYVKNKLSETNETLKQTTENNNIENENIENEVLENNILENEKE